MGYILLEGGAEFGGRMEIPDRRALALGGGSGVRVSIIPTAAAPDNNHERAGQNGVRWFQGLGATRVTSLPLIDRASADDPEVVVALRQSHMIYMLGGFPHHLGQSLNGSLAWDAMLAAYQSGAVIAGSSAGAMVLCEAYYDPGAGRIHRGLGLVPRVCVLPHHDTFGESWAPELKRLLPDTMLIGIDEETGMLGSTPRGMWQVHGKGAVTLYRQDQRSVYGPEQPFRLQRRAFCGQGP
jgi:cyanophycinase